MIIILGFFVVALILGLLIGGALACLVFFVRFGIPILLICAVCGLCGVFDSSPTPTAAPINPSAEITTNKPTAEQISYSLALAKETANKVAADHAAAQQAAKAKAVAREQAVTILHASPGYKAAVADVETWTKIVESEKTANNGRASLGSSQQLLLAKAKVRGMDDLAAIVSIEKK